MSWAPTHRGARRVVVELLVASLAAALLVFAWRADRNWSEDHMTQFFCATGPEELRHASALRWGAAVLGVVMLLVVRPLLGAWAARSGSAHTAWTIGSVGGAALMALVVCDVYLRLRQKEPAPPKKECTNVEFYRSDPAYGWGHRTSRTLACLVAGRRIEYTTNSFEARSRAPDDVIDPSRQSILFTGESIAWGDGLQYDELYATRVGADLGVQSVNYAIGNFAPDQAYQRAVEGLAKLEHPVAVVTLVVPVEIPRGVAWDRRRLGLAGDGSFEAVEPTSELIRESPLLKLFRAIVPYHGDEAVEVARAAFEATAKAARARNAYPLFVFTPFNYGKPCMPTRDGLPRIVHRLFSGGDLPYVSVDIDPAWRIPGEDHPDARGDRKIAEAIERALVEARVASYAGNSRP